MTASRHTRDPRPQARHHARVRIPSLLAALIFVTLADGCSDDTPTAQPEASPAPSATSASPTPAASPSPTAVADPNRAACHEVSYVEEVSITAHFEPVYARPAADYALQSDTEAIHQAGYALGQALDAVENGYGDNLATGRAWLDLAKACGNLYGDGPW